MLLFFAMEEQSTNQKTNKKFSPVLASIVALVFISVLGTIAFFLSKNKQIDKNNTNDTLDTNTQSNQFQLKDVETQVVDEGDLVMQNEELKKLVIVDTKVGSGAEAKAGDSIVVHYTGTLLNGTKFDSSVGGTPFKFELGAGDVIAGWDQGLVGMKVGGMRKLTIPSDLAYGNISPSPLIPANSVLVFEVELLAIQ